MCLSGHISLEEVDIYAPKSDECGVPTRKEPIHDFTES
ncbi:MAG: hypothetical protein K0Q50_930 [Vampirovibrio sp.]|jgi:hypothetical protein|nr:hypothetical protein [Vampirovibrio sp.]